MILLVTIRWFSRPTVTTLLCHVEESPERERKRKGRGRRGRRGIAGVGIGARRIGGAGRGERGTEGVGRGVSGRRGKEGVAEMKERRNEKRKRRDGCGERSVSEENGG